MTARPAVISPLKVLEHVAGVLASIDDEACRAHAAALRSIVEGRQDATEALGLRGLEPENIRRARRDALIRALAWRFFCNLGSKRAQARAISAAISDPDALDGYKRELALRILSAHDEQIGWEMIRTIL